MYSVKCSVHYRGSADNNVYQCVSSPGWQILRLAALTLSSFQIFQPISSLIMRALSSVIIRHSSHCLCNCDSGIYALKVCFRESAQAEPSDTGMMINFGRIYILDSCSSLCKQKSRFYQV